MDSLDLQVLAQLKGVDAAVRCALIEELSVAAGTVEGMIAGQVYDTLGGFPEAMGPRERLVLIHRNKTGALIRASVRMGALCGLAGNSRGVEAEPDGQRLDGQELRALTVYADAVGVVAEGDTAVLRVAAGTRGSLRRVVVTTATRQRAVVATTDVRGAATTVLREVATIAPRAGTTALIRAMATGVVGEGGVGAGVWAWGSVGAGVIPIPGRIPTRPPR